MITSHMRKDTQWQMQMGFQGFAQPPFLNIPWKEIIWSHWGQIISFQWDIFKKFWDGISIANPHPLIYTAVPPFQKPWIHPWHFIIQCLQKYTSILSSGLILKDTVNLSVSVIKIATTLTNVHECFWSSYSTVATLYDFSVTVKAALH